MDFASKGHKQRKGGPPKPGGSRGGNGKPEEQELQRGNSAAVAQKAEREVEGSSQEDLALYGNKAMVDSLAKTAPEAAKSAAHSTFSAAIAASPMAAFLKSSTEKSTTADQAQAVAQVAPAKGVEKDPAALAAGEKAPVGKDGKESEAVKSGKEAIDDKAAKAAEVASPEKAAVAKGKEAEGAGQQDKRKAAEEATQKGKSAEKEDEHEAKAAAAVAPTAHERATTAHDKREADSILTEKKELELAAKEGQEKLIHARDEKQKAVAAADTELTKSKAAMYGARQAELNAQSDLGLAQSKARSGDQADVAKYQAAADKAAEARKAAEALMAEKKKIAETLHKELAAAKLALRGKDGALQDAAIDRKMAEKKVSDMSAAPAGAA